MSRKVSSVQLPAAFVDEIEQIVARTQRSSAFVALRALAAAPDAPAVPTAATKPLVLETGEDDPPALLAKIKAAAKGRTLDEALAAAWAATRDRFEKWAAREESLRRVEQADDLDDGLREAEDPNTSPERLVALAASPYPRIRALVAAHLRLPLDVLARLTQDREPYVREAAARR